MKLRQASLPAAYEPKLRVALKVRGYSLDEPARLAEAVLKLSDFYLEHPSAPTPWEESWAQVASLVYFFPLNYARCALIAREGARFKFFAGLDTVVDDGAGMGSATHAVRDHFADKQGPEPAPCSWLARDVSPTALSLLNELNTSGILIRTEKVSGLTRPMGRHAKATSLLIASYVFTELKDIPKEWLEYEALIIVEPSTRPDARRLQGERETLLAAGFSLWAPCPHADDCPLLVSDKDWCHDRVHFSAPAWFAAIEKNLPMKNKTLSFSYLMARKKPAPLMSWAGIGPKPARLVGDTLIEKGKSRQALCRSREKEFLTWFPQRFKVKGEIELSRGSLIKLKGEIEKKAQEVRIRESDQVYEFDVSESID